MYKRQISTQSCIQLAYVRYQKDKTKLASATLGLSNVHCVSSPLTVREKLNSLISALEITSYTLIATLFYGIQYHFGQTKLHRWGNNYIDISLLLITSDELVQGKRKALLSVGWNVDGDGHFRTQNGHDIHSIHPSIQASQHPMPSGSKSSVTSILSISLSLIHI